jgi:hypothetical protein
MPTNFCGLRRQNPQNEWDFPTSHGLLDATIAAFGQASSVFKKRFLSEGLRPSADLDRCPAFAQVKALSNGSHQFGINRLADVLALVTPMLAFNVSPEEAGHRPLCCGFFVVRRE